MMKNRKLSAVVAMMLALSVIASGCQKINEDGELPSLNEVTLTDAEPTDTTAQTEETTEVTTEETTQPTETEATEETTTAPSETEATTAPESSETEQTTTAQTWTETAKSGTMYVTENCYSRERAIVGSTPISQHYRGDSVEVTAITDTGYYKLADGGFIHSDYLSDSKPVEQTTAATEKPADNPSSGDNSSGGASGGSSSGGVTGLGNYKTSHKSRYSYKQLTATEQKFYDDVMAAVMEFRPYVMMPAGLSEDDAFKVFTIIFNGEPQLFWLDSSVRISSSKISIGFLTTDPADIAAKQKEIDAAASKILSKANQYSGTVSKLKVMYDALVTGNEFSDAGGYTSTIYNALTFKNGIQCGGYAKAMQYLCDMAGIEATTVAGVTSSGVTHAWNIVYCENGYYNLDVTWGDPLNDFGSDYVQYEFFLVPDSWIHNITHFDVSTRKRSNGTKVYLFDPPACTKEACNYFAAYNKLYDNQSNAEAAMKTAIAEAVAAGSNVAEIRVTSKALYDTLMTDDYFKTFQRYAKEKSGNVDYLLRRGANTKGVYVVHYDICYK